MTRIKRALLSSLLITVSAVGWSQAEIKDDSYLIKEINISDSDMSDTYIRRLLTFKEGDHMSDEELEKALSLSRVLAQNDSSIYLIEFETRKNNSDLFVEVIVYDAVVKFSFGAFSTGPVIEYRNLFGEGIDVGTHLGFSRQMLSLNWKRIANAPIGFSFLAGHQIFNEFEADYRTSALGSTNRLYLWLGRHINLGVLNEVYANLSGGWEEAGGITTLGLGGYLHMDYYYLIDLVDIGFELDAGYLHYLQDLNNANKVYAKSRIYIRPFNTNRMAFEIAAHLHLADNDLVSRGKNALSADTGRTAWDLGLYIPVLLGRISGGAEYYIGLEPGVIMGRAGTDELELSNPNVGISLAPVLQIGFPASIKVAARLIYNISEERFSFHLGFSNMPYTKELDKGW